MAEEPGRERTLALLLACQGFLVAGITLSFPFFALYLNRERGLEMGLVGLVMSGMLGITAVAQSLGGELADLWGAKRVMALALGGRALLLGALAEAMWSARPLALVVALHVAGTALGNLFDPAIRAWIADHYAPAARLGAYAKLRIAINAGWAFGPAVGGFLAESSYPLLFAVSCAVAALCWAGLRWGLAETAGTRSGQRFEWGGALSVARDGRFLEFCAWCVMISMVTAQLVVGLSIHAVGFVGLTERQVGALWALNGLLVLLLQSQVTERLRPMRLTAMLAWGSLLYAAGYAWVGFAGGWAGLMAAMCVITFGELVLLPGLPALAANLAPDALKGRYLGFWGLAHQAGCALAPLIGGLGLQHLSPRWAPAPWLAIGMIGTAAAWGFWRFGRRLAPQEQS